MKLPHIDGIRITAREKEVLLCANDVCFVKRRYGHDAGFTTGDIYSMTNIPRSTIHKSIAKLIAKNLIKRCVGVGVAEYVLLREGQRVCDDHWKRVGVR